MIKDTVLSYFCEMKDPRAHNVVHSLESIVFIAIAAKICGADTWEDVEEFGIIWQDWLSEYLDLSHGTPSHDTFNRFFSILDPDEFEHAFRKWIATTYGKVSGDVISIDGKTMRGTGGIDTVAAHIVSAWSSNNEIAIAQLKTDAKSNEITAIPELLDAMLIKGNLITIDAMGCQRKIASKIIEKQGDYILALKGNQKELYRDVVDSFRFITPSNHSEDLDAGHGRIERRKCTVIEDLSMLIEQEDKPWVGLKSIVKIDGERINKTTGEVSIESRYYISSISDAKFINDAVRKHWGIENKLHWVLDMTFSEDYSRCRTKNAADNTSRLNKIALNLIKKNKNKKSIKVNRKAAGWSKQRLLRLMRL